MPSIALTTGLGSMVLPAAVALIITEYRSETEHLLVIWNLKGPCLLTAGVSPASVASAAMPVRPSGINDEELHQDINMSFQIWGCNVKQTARCLYPSKSAYK